MDEKELKTLLEDQDYLQRRILFYESNHVISKSDSKHEIKENPEKWLSPTINGGDFRHFSDSDFLKSKIAKSPEDFTRIHLQL